MFCSQSFRGSDFSLCVWDGASVATSTYAMSVVTLENHVGFIDCTLVLEDQRGKTFQMAFFKVLMNPLASFLDKATPFDDPILGEEFQMPRGCLTLYFLDITFCLGTFGDPLALSNLGVSESYLTPSINFLL